MSESGSLVARQGERPRVSPPPGSLLRLVHPKAASLHSLAVLICTPVYVLLFFPSDLAEGRALPHQISSEVGRISPLFPQ